MKTVTVIGALSVMALLGVVSAQEQRAGNATTNTPWLVDVTPTNAVVTADTNALAGLVREEAALAVQAEDMTRQAMELNRPIWEERQRIMREDKELAAMTAAVAAKQKEIEARLIAKYPDLAMKINSQATLSAQCRDINVKLRDIRKQIEAMQMAIDQQPPQKAAP